MSTPSEGGELSFERDIKPLFRTKDRDSMMQAFDLFDYDDVVENADAIVGSLRSGQMPCDGAWPAGQVDTLQQWIEQEAVKLGRAIARDPAFAPFTAGELTPGDAVADDDALAQAIGASIVPEILSFTTNVTVIILAERIYQRVYAN
jgi:hypothetical protein